MGLRGEGSPHEGLRLLLETPPPPSGGRIATELDQLTGDLPCSLSYVLGQPGEATDLVSDGVIDYDAVRRHIAAAVSTAQSEAALAAKPAINESSVLAEPEGHSDPAASVSPPGPEAGAVALTEAASWTAGGAMPAAVSSSSTLAAQSSASSSSGRLGPRDVIMTEIRGSCDIHDGHLLSRANFSTLRGNVCVYSGKWMYEVLLSTRGIMQLGWTTLGARFTSEEGVGDSRDSFAYDGKRRRRWNVDAVAYGESWAAGDVIGCCIDMDAGTISYRRNGKDMGVAFSGILGMAHGMAYFPGISLSYAEACWVNFGTTPFVHPVEGYQPLQQRLPSSAQPGSQLAAACYLTGCLSRLLDVTGPEAAASPAAAAALVAVRSLPFGSQSRTQYTAHVPEWLKLGGGFTQSQLGALRCQILSFKLLKKLLQQKHQEGQVEADQGDGQQQQQQEQQQIASLEQSLDPTLLEGCFPPPLPAPPPVLSSSRLDSAAVEAAAAGLDLDLTGSSKQGGAAVGALAAGTECNSPAIDDADSLLLTAALMEQLGPTCLEPYLAEGALLLLLRDTWGGGSERERRRLHRLLDWLAAAGEVEELQSVVSSVCEALGREVRACAWQRDQLPASPAASALELWVALLRHSAFRGRWVASPDWMPQLEALLTVRQPTSADLAQLFPDVQWSESDGHYVLRGAMGASSLGDDMQRVGQALQRLEELQEQLLLLLWQHTGSSSSCGGGSGGAATAELLQQLQGQPLAASVAEAAAAQSQEQHPCSRAAGGGALSPSQATEREADESQAGHLVRCFLQYLIDRNHGVTRNVPPPGLSNPSVLVSTYWAAARLAREQLRAVHMAGRQFAWDPACCWLQGRPLTASDDPYWDEARLGGTLSHLTREHPPAEGERWRPVVVPAIRERVVHQPDLPRGPQLRRPGQPLLDCWLWDRLLMLHHLGVTPALRDLFGHLQTLEQAIATLAALSERPNAAGAARLASDCKREILSALRHHAWAQSWLLTGWKQEMALGLAVTMCRVLDAAGEQGQDLLRYAPELYLETTLDMLHAVRRAEPVVLHSEEDWLGRGLEVVIAFVVRHLTDTRIVNPETRGMLLQSIWVMLQDKDLLGPVASNPVAQQGLLPALMSLLGEQRFWVQVVNVLLLLVEDTGFLRPPPPGPTSTDARSALAMLRGGLPAACAADPGLCGEYLTELFGYCNWALTELVVSLEEVESHAARRAGDLTGTQAAHVARRASVTGELCASLLRVLELTATQLPGAFLRGPPLNMTRLSELISFAVPAMFRAGTVAALRRLASSSAAQSAGVAGLEQADLLRPLAGVIVALWAEQQAAEAAGRPVEHSLVGALASLAAVTEAHLEALQELDWGPEASKPPGQQQLAALLACLAAVRTRRAELAATGAGREGGAGGAGGEEPPAEFLDPIMCTLMQDPVVLPDSHITIDRPTIERHLLTSKTDPFSRAPLTSADQLQPDKALQQQIRDWLQRQGAGGAAPDPGLAAATSAAEPAAAQAAEGAP